MVDIKLSNRTATDGESKLHKILTGALEAADLQTLVVPKLVSVASLTALEGGASLSGLADKAADLTGPDTGADLSRATMPTLSA